MIWVGDAGLGLETGRRPPRRSRSRALGVHSSAMPADGLSRFAKVEHAVHSHFFLHIPKTGGTSIEQSVRPDLSAFGLYRNCCPSASIIVGNGAGSCCTSSRASLRSSPWHLPPDLFARQFGHEVEADENHPGRRLQRWCVVRNPVDRWLSESRWHEQGELNGKWPIVRADGQFAMVPPSDARTLRDAYRDRRRRVEWTEELVHFMPQHWFVWAADGTLQCQCVLAFEHVHQLMQLRINNSSSSVAQARGGASPAASKRRMPAELQELYALDAVLHAAALNASRLCYRPAASLQAAVK